MTANKVLWDIVPTYVMVFTLFVLISCVLFLLWNMLPWVKRRELEKEIKRKQEEERIYQENIKRFGKTMADSLRLKSDKGIDIDDSRI